ncbi:PQQ-dependent sugar dehydrogenase [Colwellia sp. 1_MG-2023]|uniref:PQQ-dependent sugar dehydrogenase n=1 Tax=unclassified Colwellia TaxID=196834 RepID=UPI001C099E84|nr:MULTISPECIES: PQQ-dependent sugar dehydrogenase [unclassified Colwellia]MBU2924899.1 PQQ-dependent sugar dehydrogenase [Colwellia sp. C2M11]MDO6487668.1 PQQ-dependent sugar dehydrogenase [Colwellia sp. 6_MG-2023]MDO6652871.1 PQQ-dependent sugar dehydrogenase [Colwellia sp. 3_MG-2023]MDO6665873.1 PQQ-dependent sugar dehydrogenase [Colwellia sp. 2_MG-2023]MDO6690246.1 PQQ-dependent sugar dehydrogenase [Colwellia sp. 1_MG-2023]
MRYLIVTVLIFLSSTAHAKHSIYLEKNKGTYKTELMWPEVSIPWGMVQLPGGEMLATERSGTLFLLTENEPAIEIQGLPKIHVNNQGGLLDIALHPYYEKNHLILFSYASPEGEGKGSHTALMQAKLDIKNNRLTQQKVLYKGEGNTTKGSHYGSRIVVDDDYIYFSIGDRGARDLNPQDLSRDGGKIYRLNLDGSIPDDNPFVQSNSAKKAIFSYGHRNPQGLVKLGDTGVIWSHEHGPKGGDEVNLIEAGKNYGWPIISYGVNYNGSAFTDLTEKIGMEQPKLFWDPSIAPSGMAVITSDKYPQWQGKILLGSLKFNHLVLLEVKDSKVVKQTKVVTETGGRYRNVIQGSDGYIYLGVDGEGISRLLPMSVSN